MKGYWNRFFKHKDATTVCFWSSVFLGCLRWWVISPMGNPPILESIGNMYDWLVVWNMFYFPFHIWDNPSHWLSYVSRWLKPPTRWIYLIFWSNLSKSKGLVIGLTSVEGESMDQFSAKLPKVRGNPPETLVSTVFLYLCRIHIYIYRLYNMYILCI